MGAGKENANQGSPTTDTANATVPVTRAAPSSHPTRIPEGTKRNSIPRASGSGARKDASRRAFSDGHARQVNAIVVTPANNIETTIEVYAIARTKGFATGASGISVEILRNPFREPASAIPSVDVRLIPGRKARVAHPARIVATIRVLTIADRIP